MKTNPSTRLRCLVLLPALVLPFLLESRSLGQDAGKKAQQLFEQAQSQEKEKKYELAVKSMQQAIKLAPRNDAYLAYASHVERLAGNYAEGTEHALQAIAINGKVGWYYAAAAFNANSNRDVDLAREFCKKTIALGAKSVGKVNLESAQHILEELSDHVYTINWVMDPKKGLIEDGTLALPLPSTNLPFQKSEWEVSGVKEHKTVVREGNEILLVVPDGDKPILLKAKVTVSAFSYRKPLAEKAGKVLPREVLPYLGASEGIDPKSPKLASIVAELKNDDPRITVKNITAWMNKNIKYKIVYFDNVEKIIEAGHCECGGWGALFSALCRVAGVPAREVWGVVKATTDFAPPGHLKGHVWAEFYIAGVGWVPIEPQNPESLGMMPVSYVRMYHYDVLHGNRVAEKRRANANMWGMGGDIPKYTESR